MCNLFQTYFLEYIDLVFPYENKSIPNKRRFQSKRFSAAKVSRDNRASLPPISRQSSLLSGAAHELTPDNRQDGPDQLLRPHGRVAVRDLPVHDRRQHHRVPLSQDLAERPVQAAAGALLHPPRGRGRDRGLFPASGISDGEALLPHLAETQWSRFPAEAV